MAYSHGTKWDENKIVEEILKMVKEKGMDTFPSHSEMKSHFGNDKLVCAVSKHGGTQYFSKLTGLKIKECESKFGDYFEILCMRQIEEKLNLSCEKTRPRFPYDILVEKAVKIDVKSCKQFKNYGSSPYYTFNLQKKHQSCDIYVFYCSNEEKEINRTLVIPSFVISGKTQLAIGQKSMYDVYQNRWDIISDYSSFIKSTI